MTSRYCELYDLFYTFFTTSHTYRYRLWYFIGFRTGRSNPFSRFYLKFSFMPSFHSYLHVIIIMPDIIPCFVFIFHK